MMKYSGITAVLRAALVAALFAMPVAARAGGGDYDGLDKGPRIGAMIPLPLAAMDQLGKARDFGSLRGRRGLILLFSRSLGW